MFQCGVVLWETPRGTYGSASFLCEMRGAQQQARSKKSRRYQSQAGHSWLERKPGPQPTALKYVKASFCQPKEVGEL